MAKLYNEQTITNIGDGVKAYEGNFGQSLMDIGKDLDDYSKEQEREYNNSLNAYTQSMKNLTAQSMQDIYAQYENDPVKLQEEFNRLDNELINNIPDEDLKLQFKSEFLLDSSTYINRSKSKLKKQEEARLKQSREFGLVNAMNLRATALQNMMSGDASADDIVNFNKSMKDIGDLLSSKDAYGIYTFSPSQQDKYIKELDKSVGEAFVSKMYESDFEDLDKANKLLHENKYTVSYFDDNGMKQEINIKDMVDAKTYQNMKDKTYSLYNKAKKVEYAYQYEDFMKNPTKSGLERLEKLNPDMKQKTKDDLIAVLENDPSYIATTSFYSIQDAQASLDELANFTESTGYDNLLYLEKMTDYIRRLQISNKENTLEEEDVNKYANLAYRMINDKVFAEQVHSVLGQPSAFAYGIEKVFLGDNLQKVRQIGILTARDTIDRLLENDIDGAISVYKEGQQKAIRLRYPDIDFTNIKEGDIIWYAPTKQALKFVGYGVDDILVEVDPQNGVIK